MKAELYCFLMLVSVVNIKAESQTLCSNGVFKCVSPISLRICFLDKLVTSEFFCPKSTFCNENSPTICTKIPAALPAIEYHEESVTTDAEIYPEIQCMEPGIFKVENTGCTTFLNCSNLGEVQELTCDEVSLFNPGTKTCNENYICPETLDSVQTYDDCYNSFICTKVGNFLIPNTNCVKFIYCKRIYTGFIPIEKFCPKNTLFDPIFGKCIKGHICKDECTTTSGSITTTPFYDFNTTISETTPEDFPKCPGIGRFPIPNTNCTMYRLCSNTTNGFVHKDYTCPSGFYFNPNTTKCSSNYECWSHITSTVSSVTTASLITDTTVISTSISSITSDISSSSTKDPNSTDLPITNSSSTASEDSTSNPTGISTPNSTNAQNSTTSNPITTEKDITNDVSSSSTKDSNSTDLPIINSSTTAFDGSTPNPTEISTSNSTNAQNSTTSNPITTENLSDLPIINSSTTTFDVSTPNPTDISTPNLINTTTPNLIDTTTPNLIDSSNSTDASTPNSTDVQDTTTYSNPITTEENITEDISLSSTKDPNSTNFPIINSSITTSKDSTPNQDTTPNITDLPSTTEHTSLNSTEDSFFSTSNVDLKTTSKIITDDTAPNSTAYFESSTSTTEFIITQSTTDISENTDYTDESSSHSIDDETTTDSNTEQLTTPTIDCRNQGRLPVLNSNCKMYYQCTLTTNGYKYILYECSNETLFDPYKKICSNVYNCPDTISNTTTDKTITELQNSTTTDYTTADSDETTEEIPIELNCTQQGKFPVPNSSCLLYGQCVLTTSGFIQSIYECSKGSLYDPKMKLCSASYICPETISETTTDKDITTVTMDHSKISPSTSTEIFSPIIPSCTGQGKFPILNTNCKNYISCILTTNGFNSFEYVCSGNLLFDPILKKCSSNYICIENIAHFPKSQEIESTNEAEYVNKLTTPTIKSDFVNCSENGKFPIPYSKCSQFVICSSTSNGFKFKIYTCPLNSFYDPENKRCSQTYSCSELDTTSNTEVPPRTTSTDFDIPECRESGKLSIDNTGCRKYILCSLTTIGFKSKIYTCPVDSFFNPGMKRCQKEYICPELSADLETTTEIFSSEENPEECVDIDVLKENLVCTKTGKFPVSGTNCKQYLLCTQTSLGFRSKVYNCPNDSNFDPSKSKCVFSYSCLEKICGVDNAKAVKLINKPIVSKCISPGKFSIKGTNCKKFKLCVWTNLGYTKTVYDCPEGTYFDQRLQLCSENYNCTEDKLYNCTTIGQFKDPSDITCRYYINCKANSEGIVRGEQKICPKDYYFDPMIQKCSAYYMCKEKKLVRAMEETPKFLVNNLCTTVGRYAITGTNCKNYMYCADNGGGTLKGTLFTCPTTTVFNQVIQKCVATYICPDSVCPSPCRTANPNSKDCTSYIQCEDVIDAVGLIVGSTGRVEFCPLGQKFDPIRQCCSFTNVR